MYNTYYLQELQPSHNTYARLNGSIYEEIAPVKGLTLRAQQSLEAYDYRYTYLCNPQAGGPFEGQGSRSENFSRFYQFTFTNTAEYKFNVEQNNVAILLGQEAILDNYEGMGISVDGITDWRTNLLSQGTKTNTPSQSFSETVYNSYFARLSYDYNSKYFVDASWRLDGSSLFGKNKRYANFYSIGAMWDIKREDFMQNASWLQDLRLKASYGTTGNSGIGQYLAYGTIGTYGVNYDGTSGWGVGNPSNDDLTWETIETLNIGITGRMWNFLNVSAEFYNKMTRDMLMEIPYSYTTGHGGGWGNVGNMLNRGIDVEFGFDVVQTQNTYFNIKTNFNYNYNEITELFGGRDKYTIANTGISYQVGYPYGEFYYVRSAGVDPQDGMQMWYDLDGNKTKQFSDAYAVMTGKQRFAPWSGGLQLNFQYKGLYVGADFSWVAGKWTVNNDRYFITNPKFVSTNMNGVTELFDIWTKPGQVTDVPSIDSPREFDTTLLENASFLRLKNLQISYEFPKAWMAKTGFIGSMRVYAIGRNLFTLTKYQGYDPEVDSNLQMGVYPNSRQFTVGLEFTF
jgi:TonB-linked SusC/RagA family outer membrane protein